jgi:ubiquinone/menaquinone biosynthesis C-methylase UbiE
MKSAEMHMLSSFQHRADETEIMDDLTQPDHEFSAAYRELEIINANLGGVRAIERFLPPASDLLILDVAAGACDVSESLLRKRRCRIVTLDLNERGLQLARRSWPVVGDALDLPFRDGAFDVVMASLFFHHLSNDACVHVLSEMWRIARQRVLVNDLHRHRVAYVSIRALTALFSKSKMVRHDGPTSVRRAFRPSELLDIAKRAGVAARVCRSFPYRLVLVAEK